MVNVLELVLILFFSYKLSEIPVLGQMVKSFLQIFLGQWIYFLHQIPVQNPPCLHGVTCKLKLRLCSKGWFSLATESES